MTALANRPRELTTDRGGFLTIKDVIAATTFSRATIYRKIAADEFPQQVKLSTRRVGWWERDVQAWAESRPFGGINGP